jgi:iron transport multicopper oxidase
MVATLRSLLSLLVVATSASAADLFYHLTMQNVDAAPDGFVRQAILPNQQFPGPLITGTVNDSLHINVTMNVGNPDMRQSTSIHWHGLFQARTSSEDGPAQVNQCPISPNQSYQYDIHLNGQSGTFWYHSHLATQYVDGERGPLVIYDPNDPSLHLYDVDDETTIMSVNDWYHNLAVPLQAAYFSPDNGGGLEPTPDSGLFNGVGRFNGGPETPWAVVNVQSGLRYRFRMINMSGFAQFQCGIQDHVIQVMEADGIIHDPVSVDSFTIYVAQRYSFVLTANQPVANYWISTVMTVNGASNNKNLDTKNIFGILRYAGAPAADPPGSFLAGGNVLQEQDLHPTVNPGAPGGSGPADVVIDLDFTKTVDANKSVAWEINGIQYIPPDIPTLVNIIQNDATTANDFLTSEHTFVVGRNQVVEVNIKGALNGITHPFHLHGHAFDVIQSSDGGGLNFVNPPRRDVVGVGGPGVIIRFLTDNPGSWFLHCHIDWHLEAGLAVVFAERPEDSRVGNQSQIVKQTWLDLCPMYDALPPNEQRRRELASKVHTD